MSSKIIRLKTEDNCEIALYRNNVDQEYSKNPVLLVHGFAANAQMWTPATQDLFLADYLSQRGFPVYSIDLRFRRGAPNRDWDTDDYVLFDIPRHH